MRSVEGFALPVSGAVSGGAMAAAATALGAVPLLVVRRISADVQGMLLGFGAGVMLAASVFSLLLPAFEAAQAQAGSELGAATLVALGLLLGAGGLLAMDRALPTPTRPKAASSAAAVGCSCSRLRCTTSRKAWPSASPPASTAAARARGTRSPPASRCRTYPRA